MLEDWSAPSLVAMGCGIVLLAAGCGALFTYTLSWALQVRGKPQPSSKPRSRHRATVSSAGNRAAGAARRQGDSGVAAGGLRRRRGRGGSRDDSGVGASGFSPNASQQALADEIGVDDPRELAAGLAWADVLGSDISTGKRQELDESTKPSEQAAAPAPAVVFRGVRADCTPQMEVLEAKGVWLCAV